MFRDELADLRTQGTSSGGAYTTHRLNVNRRLPGYRHSPKQTRSKLENIELDKRRSGGTLSWTAENSAVQMPHEHCYIKWSKSIKS